MVIQPCRKWFQRCAITGSLALSCLWSATSFAAASCPAYVFNAATLSDPFSQTASTNQGITLKLAAGLLQPQLEDFIREQFSVELIDWRVSVHYQWPAAFQISATNAEQLLEKLLRPYRIAITIYSNRTAVVSYRQSTEVRS